jgi:2-polyprenyl-3-methyl-5-hydroxy-6-metoxy-1,4-benzoquinol methylase
VYLLSFFLPPRAYKQSMELRFWKHLYSVNNWKSGFANLAYETLYTGAFGLLRKDYNAKRVLDIGCGPMGSLEWANMTAQRVGLDPLVPYYLKLGAVKHKMEYVAARSEDIPFPEGHFDIVTCLNALDHVDDLDATIREV